MVSASPLNGVKLDLAIILVIGVVLFIIVLQLIESFIGQFLILAVYGVLTTIWLIRKTRKILSAHGHDIDDQKTQ